MFLDNIFIFLMLLHLLLQCPFFIQAQPKVEHSVTRSGGPVTHICNCNCIQNYKEIQTTLSKQLLKSIEFKA
jgi:hypothetical protein